ncbi:MAG: adenine phosphoribosyltransferase [Candidatus Eisenbacteria bacterium]|jgi:adenine phosphoribosyltransferase|nr:adenine phosphoribosyltransferase [Candidatus Eisenbacteria bacterium]
MELAGLIRSIPDFPKPGIVFKDITTLLGDAEAFSGVIEAWAERLRSRGVTRILAIEARGFIFGGALAHHLRVPLALARKPGKLPWLTIRESYSLEYGTDSLEIHRDAIVEGDRVAVVDDLLATGGTALAAIRLAEQLGGEVVDVGFLIELAFLSGRRKLERYPVESYIAYASEA